MKPAQQGALAGRNALVTGSSAGLGHAIADALAAGGAHVVLHGLPGDPNGSIAAHALQARHSTRVLWQPADLCDLTQIEQLVQAAQDSHGPVDILVNNAVVRHIAPAHELSPRQWDEALAVNLSAAFHLARLTLGGMRAQHWGRIVNLSSVYGARGAENRIGYVTTKTALLGMTRALALEGARWGITCNAVAPGTTPTPAIIAKIDAIAREQDISAGQAARDYLGLRQPTGRYIAPEGVAALVAFLCSAAAQDITGATLPVDGGWTAA